MTNDEHSRRDLENAITTDPRAEITDDGYRRLERLLSAQQPLNVPEHHDELRFIIEHQTSKILPVRPELSG